MRFTLEFKRTFPGSLDPMWTKYIHTIHPWEFDNHELYWSGWEKDEEEALKFIVERHPRKVVQRGDDFQIRFESLQGKRDFLPQSMVLQLSTAEQYKGWSFPDWAFPDTKIRDPALRTKVQSWAVKYYRLRFLRSTMISMVEDILDEDEGLNTPGQLYRVWPEIASVMPQKYSGKVMRQKLTSALPPAFLERWTVDEFRKQEYFDEVTNHLLAMSVMDLKEAEVYPYAFG